MLDVRSRTLDVQAHLEGELRTSNFEVERGIPVRVFGGISLFSIQFNVGYSKLDVGCSSPSGGRTSNFQLRTSNFEVEREFLSVCLGASPCFRFNVGWFEVGCSSPSGGRTSNFQL